MTKLKLFVYLALIVGLLLLLKFKGKNYYNIPTFNTETTINAVIEIPAGTNHKIEYNPGSNRFIYDKINGSKRIINFLPYPVNYGFIPSTLMDTMRGGDGDALDIIIISEYIKTKTTLEVIPVGILQLLDNNEIDDKIIAIPADEGYRIISAIKFRDLEDDYPEILDQIRIWFLNYKGSGKIEFKGWKDEKAAMKAIAKWAV